MKFRVVLLVMIVLLSVPTLLSTPVLSGQGASVHEKPYFTGNTFAKTCGFLVNVSSYTPNNGCIGGVTFDAHNSTDKVTITIEDDNFKFTGGFYEFRNLDHDHNHAHQGVFCDTTTVDIPENATEDTELWVFVDSTATSQVDCIGNPPHEIGSTQGNVTAEFFNQSS